MNIWLFIDNILPISWSRPIVFFFLCLSRFMSRNPKNNSYNYSLEMSMSCYMQKHPTFVKVPRVETPKKLFFTLVLHFLKSQEEFIMDALIQIFFKECRSIPLAACLEPSGEKRTKAQKQATSCCSRASLKDFQNRYLKPI